MESMPSTTKNFSAVNCACGTISCMIYLPDGIVSYDVI